jgi:eukaryotic-like serine/threonine-protein kinase
MLGRYPMDSVDELEGAMGPRETQPILSVAAQSIAVTSGVAATVADVVHDRALSHYAERLRQYLAVRLGSVEQAGAAMGELRAAVAAVGPEKLAAPPGMRANLFREARRVALERTRTSRSVGIQALPWRPPRSVPPAVSARVRSELGEPEAEALELRYARELPVDEVAHVLGLASDETRARLAAGEEVAKRVLAEATADMSVGRFVLEAFALEADASTGDGASQREALAPGTVMGGRFAIERRVGTGAFGDVYRAKDVDVPGHVVALKLLRQPARTEEGREQALRELHIIASVFHPSVVQFKDSGWFEDRLWFVMPWYEGETLEKRLRRAPLTRPQARRIFEPLARALATMHEAGIRHQDVKPDNIFLARIRGFGRDGEDELLPVLIDLGVAAKEAEMVVAGTPNYFAPEVAAQFASVKAKGAVGSAADVFSLALSLRNALEPQTQEDVPAGAVEAFIKRRATEPPALPVARDLRFLTPSFERWLSTDPSDRPSADRFADELAVLTRPEEHRRRLAAILRWVVPVFVTIAVVFTGVVYTLNQRAERERSEAVRARMLAVGLREDLELSLEQRRELEEDVARIRDTYEKGQLTREQFLKALSKAEAELAVVRRRLATSDGERREAEGQLSKVNREMVDALKERESLRTDLADSRSALAATMDQLAELRRAVAAAQQRAEGLEGRLASAQASLDMARQDVDQARSRIRELEARVQSLTRAYEEANAARQRAEARAVQLERGGSARPRARGPAPVQEPEPEP